MRGQSLYTVVVRYRFLAPDRATALLTLREHIAGTEYESMEIESVELPDEKGLDIDNGKV